MAKRKEANKSSFLMRCMNLVLAQPEDDKTVSKSDLK